MTKYMLNVSNPNPEVLESLARASPSIGSATQPNNASTTAAAAIVGDAMRAAAAHRRRLTLACVVVLISFPCRVAFDLLQAYATYNVQYNELFSSPCGITPAIISALNAALSSQNTDGVQPHTSLL